MVSIIQAIILSIIQGITEFLPISSSGHLALTQQLFGFQNLPFDVFLHFASIIAVIAVFWKPIVNVLNLKKKDNLRYLFYLLIALIPAAIIGLLFRETIEKTFSNMMFLGFFFIFSGIIIYSTKFAREKRKKISFFDSLFIGIFQAIAIFPGISRSGMTISSALFRNMEKKRAVIFSFLLAIPVVLGASLVEAKSIIFSEIDALTLIISFIVTLFASIIAIKFLLRIVRKRKFYLFGVYDILLGILVLVLAL